MDRVEGIQYLKREIGTPALTKEHIAMMCFAGVYLLLFSIVVPLLGLWMMFQVRHQQAERRVGTMAGFIMDGYRREVAWFWEFIVLARKLIILSVSLFIWEPFIQSFVAVVVLIIALSIQLYWQPFELIALNLLELASLASLLTTQLCGVLMWYKQQPGKTDGAELYRRGSVILLFATNLCVIAAFLFVILWYLLKQKSKMIVQWMPFTLPCFNAIAEAEEYLRWPNGSSLLREEELDMREDWKYFASQRESRLFGRGAAHSAHKKVKRIVEKVINAVDRLDVASSQRQGGGGASKASSSGSGGGGGGGEGMGVEEGGAAEGGGGANESGLRTSIEKVNPYLLARQVANNEREECEGSGGASSSSDSARVMSL
jgi:uncharacterized membrane protein YgcG